jgi:soluble lytic murein transglycosylase-like protein
MKRRNMIKGLGVLIGTSGLAMAGCFKILRDRERARWNQTPEPKEVERPKRTDWVYEIIDKHDPDSSRRDFYRAVIKVESCDKQKAVGKAGERGLMQIMPGTWRDMTNLPFSASFDPNTNVETGIKYGHWLAGEIEKGLGEKRWKNLSREERYRMVAAAYNGGIGRMKRNNFDVKKMPSSTRKYVGKVMGARIGLMKK